MLCPRLANPREALSFQQPSGDDNWNLIRLESGQIIQQVRARGARNWQLGKGGVKLFRREVSATLAQRVVVAGA
jgi:hypothetical protein